LAGWRKDMTEKKLDWGKGVWGMFSVGHVDYGLGGSDARSGEKNGRRTGGYGKYYVRRFT